MASQKDVWAFIQQVTGQNHILTAPVVFIDICHGHLDTAIFLSQCIYWSDKSKRHGGWFYKTSAEWRAELRIKRTAHDRSVTMLRDLGILDTTLRKANGVPTTHYRVNMGALYERIRRLASLEDQAETDKTGIDENQHNDMPGLQVFNMPFAENQQSLGLQKTGNSLTESIHRIPESTRARLEGLREKFGTDPIDAAVKHALGNRAPDVSHYPEHIRETISHVCSLWDLLPPTKRDPYFKLWVRDAITLQAVCGNYSSAEVLRAIFEDWRKSEARGNAYTVSGPGSLHNMARAKISDFTRTKRRSAEQTVDRWSEERQKMLPPGFNSWEEYDRARVAFYSGAPV